LLGTAAATIAVAGAASGAQAADALLKKAPPIQYVRICDRYGSNFFQLPGSSICLQLRGQVQSDNVYQPTHDIVFVSPSKTTGSYGGLGGATVGAPGGTGNAPNAQVQFANQQDNWGWEVTAKPRFDARTETSMGTLRAYAEIKIALDAGAFAGGPGPGGADTGAGNKSELFRGYLQWAGWTLGNADSIWSAGNFKNGDWANVVPTDKDSGWTAYYTWTPSGPGQPPSKGSAPVPDGWSLSFGVDEPFKHISKNVVSGGCVYYDLNLSAASPAGNGNVCATLGPVSVPDFVARIHYEADPPGKDPQHNDGFGLGTFHVAGIYHQITQIAVSGSGLLNPANLTAAGVCGTGTCTFGPPLHDHGWGVTGFLKFYVPMLPGATMGSDATGNTDSIQFNANYCDGAIEPCGVGGSAAALVSNDASWPGGLSLEALDGRLIPNGTAGTYSFEKFKAFVFNFEYHAHLTDCTDPIHCLVLSAMLNYTQVNARSVTANTDWTQGGFNSQNAWIPGIELSWGTDRYGTTKPTSWRIDSEVQYRSVNTTLPCNNNGNAALACGTPTPVPLGISQIDANHVRSQSWDLRETITFDW